MSAPTKTWTVLPHGELTTVTDRILTVVGDIHMPLGEFPRRMTVVRLANGELVIFSAIALEEAEMARLEAFGRPTWLVVPSNRHRLDAPAWKARYPEIKVATPPGAVDKVADVVPVDTTAPDFGDSTVRFVDVPGTHGNDAALEVDGPDGLTLIVNEIVGNIHGESGLKGFLLRRMGFAGSDPHIPAPVKISLKGGSEALAAHLERWANTPNLRRIVMSHGDIIDADPRGELKTLAKSLT